jgi:hypothetical protein
MEQTLTTYQAPLAFIYDRRATSQRELLEARLQACVEYSGARGWGLAGKWVDEGDHALVDRRPAFDLLLGAMRDAGGDCPRVCLVFGWGRLSHQQGVRGAMTRRVLSIGGWVETTSGDRRMGDRTSSGRLSSGPIAT